MCHEHALDRSEQQKRRWRQEQPCWHCRVLCLALARARKLRPIVIAVTTTKAQTKTKTATKTANATTYTYTLSATSCARARLNARLIARAFLKRASSRANNKLRPNCARCKYEYECCCFFELNQTQAEVGAKVRVEALFSQT